MQIVSHIIMGDKKLCLQVKSVKDLLAEAKQIASPGGEKIVTEQKQKLKEDKAKAGIICFKYLRSVHSAADVVQLNSLIFHSFKAGMTNAICSYKFNEIYISQIKLFALSYKFLPMWSCVSLPWFTTSSDLKFKLWKIAVPDLSNIHFYF